MKEIIIREMPKEKKEEKIKRPPRWRTGWMPVGTIVEYDGWLFEKFVDGAADMWRTDWLILGRA